MTINADGTTTVAFRIPSDQYELLADIVDNNDDYRNMSALLRDIVAGYVEALKDGANA